MAKIPSRPPLSGDAFAPLASYRAGHEVIWPRRQEAQAAGQNRMDRKSAMRPQQHYQITVEGVLDRRRPAWFDGLGVASKTAGRPMIAGPVADQAALRGLLAGIRDLGLLLLSVCRVDPH
jgi:hypothetical protein